MSRVTFDLDFLRSFILGLELGSYAKAAERLGRSTSAVSAQLKKLEEQAGTALFRKAGRGLALTGAGETLAAYARRLIDLNDEAAAALKDADLEGWVRLGLQEDFGEGLLPSVLARFGRAHPRLRIEARIARNADLLARLSAGELDLALVWGDGAGAPHGRRIGEFPMRWIGPAQEDIGARPLPLAFFEAPCPFRNVATMALDQAGIPWRVAFTSPSLGGLWAAISAGLAYTVRTGIGLPAGVRVMADDMPPLPVLPLALHRARVAPGPIVERLSAIIEEAVQSAVA